MPFIISSIPYERDNAPYSPDNRASYRKAFLISFQRDRSYIFGMIGHIVRRIIRRTVLSVRIDTEYAEIARMTRPHPVVRIPPELTDERKGSKYQADIIIITVNRQPELISPCRRQQYPSTWSPFSDTSIDYIHHRIDCHPPLGFRLGVFGGRQYPAWSHFPYEAGNGHITRDSAVLLRGYGPQNRLSDNHVLPKECCWILLKPQ